VPDDLDDLSGVPRYLQAARILEREIRAGTFAEGHPIPDPFLENQFTVGTVNTGTFILLLAQLGPRSFVSGAPANLREVLKNYNRTEFHHLYPRSYLRNLEVPGWRINCLANFAFVSAADNKTLGSVAPSQYKARMDHVHLADVLNSAAIPESLFGDDYLAFLSERSDLLVGVAKRLAGI
jgi:hypothetical protein